MKQPVVVIGLDSATPSVVEAWMDAGELPTMAALRDAGTYGRVKNFEAFSAETPWTTFATGVSPDTTGYWTPLKYVEDSYGVSTRAAFEYEEFAPFYAHRDLKCALFDIPQVRLDSRINGVQVAAWGAHSPQVPSGSLPEPLFAEIVQKYGEHPTLHKDYAVCCDMTSTMDLEPKLIEGIRRRGEICHDLLKQDDWDLFMTVYGEAHAAGHNFWQLSQQDHPLYDQLRPKVDHDPMLATFKAMDASMARIIEAAPEDATVMIFSAHGMGPNTMDLPSATFLPELMYRYSFGEAALLEGEYGAPLPAPIVNMDKKFWERHVWNTRTKGSKLQKFMRKAVPNRLIKYLEPMFEDVSGKTDMMPPVTGHYTDWPLPFEPASWFIPLWPQMKAFALPSFSEGYVRINLKGREPQGIVDPADYDATVEEIMDKIRALTCARTGRPMARDIIRTRRQGDNRDPKLPDADIVVLWQEEYATDTVESKEFGRIGPVPHYRAGSHRPEGFFMVRGKGIPAGARMDGGHAMDLPPTILKLIGVDVPDHIEGKALPVAEQRAPMVAE